MLNQINQKAITLLRQLDDSRLSTRLLRALYCTILEINDSYLTLHAKSLVYSTLVSLVPILAIGFSLLKYFGVHNQISPMLHNLLEPLGDKGDEIASYIINLIDNVDVNLLGIVGTLILLYTVINTLTQIEETLNHIWKVNKPRFWLKRVFYYLGVIMLSPALVVAGLLLTASLMNSNFVQTILELEPFGTLYLTLVSLLPYFTVIIGFTLVYLFLPNTKVKILTAFVGGLSAGLAWKLVGYLFAVFLKNSSNYDLIYSGFAALIIFLLWLYISWLIFLLGGLFAYSFQNSEVFNQPDKENVK